jgi:hypothetical protein
MIRVKWSRWSGGRVRGGDLVRHENGDLSCAGPRDPIFLGSDARSAFAAWHALKLALQESFVPEQGFRYAMDSAIAATPALGGPTRVFEALA